MYRSQVVFCFVVLASLGAQSANIKFYDTLNYKGLFFEYNDNPSECMALPSYGHGKLVSIITDACIILHQETTCNSSNSLRLDEGQYDDLKSLGFGDTFNAFILCNETEGGESLNADLYYTSGLQDIAVKYNGVCGCINMPNYVGTRQIQSVDNHGNCVTLFEDADCTGNFIELSGGSSAKSRNLGIYFGKPTRSISSCDDHFACLKLEAKVVKFELMSEISRANLLENSLDFELAAKTTFRNNGSAVVTQVYQATKKIVESTEISRSKGLTEMTRVETGEETEWSVSAGLSFGPFSAGTSLKNRVFESHTMERNSTYKESETYFSQDEREFSVSQTIQISPCTLYEVSSVIKFVEKYPVNYIVHARVSGAYAGLRMRAESVKERLTSMEYVEDYDEFTVVAKTYGTMNVDFGLETLIDGAGVPIQGCQQ